MGRADGMDGRKLRIGVVGVGHFGRFHALKLAAADRAELSGLYDHDPDRAQAVGAETGARAMALPELIAASDALVIAAPADAHFPLAAQALETGRHVLVEKPIAATLAQAQELGRMAADRRLVLQVGHLERFSAAYRALAGRLGPPLYIEATRIAPFKPRGTDVSVILDLMIHDLDLVLTLVDSEIESVDALGAAVASRFEDIANARLRFRNGCVATITASRISFRTERRLRLFSEQGYVVADFVARKLTMVARGGGTPLPGVEGFGMTEHAWQDHDSLAAEHAGFVAAILDGAPVLVDAAAGARALGAAIEVGTAMARSRARLRAAGLVQHPEN